MPALLTTQELSGMFDIHDYTVPRMFGLAFVRNRKGTKAANKLYCVNTVAELLTQYSGVRVYPAELFELIRLVEARQILEDMGKPRQISTWHYWRRKGIGPRVIKLGVLRRYVRSDVEAWAGQLRTDNKGGHRLPKRDQDQHDHTADSSDNGPNAELCRDRSNGGGCHLINIPVPVVV